MKFFILVRRKRKWTPRSSLSWKISSSSSCNYSMTKQKIVGPAQLEKVFMWQNSFETSHKGKLSNSWPCDVISWHKSLPIPRPPICHPPPPSWSSNLTLITKKCNPNKGISACSNTIQIHKGPVDIFNHSHLALYYYISMLNFHRFPKDYVNSIVEINLGRKKISFRRLAPTFTFQ